MKKTVLDELRKAQFPPKLIAILEGQSIYDELSPAELLCLSMYLSSERMIELVPYAELMPFTGIINILATVDEDITLRNFLVGLLKEKAVGFDQRYETLVWEGDDNSISFSQTLSLVSTKKQCFRLLEVTEKLSKIDSIIQVFKQFELDFYDWDDLYEVGCYSVRMQALDEMILIASVHDYVLYWLRIYERCLSGSDREKLALLKIASSDTDFDRWFAIYVDEDWGCRVTALALEYMQNLKGSFVYWYGLFNPTRKFYEGDNRLFLDMMLRVDGTMDEYNTLFALLEKDPCIQLRVVKRMMTMSDCLVQLC